MKQFFLLVLCLFLCQTSFAAVGEAARAKELQSLQSKDMIVYKPGKTSAVVTIFTDLDCGYCRKLHDTIPTLLKHGIEVHYLAFPRQGLNTAAYNKMVSIWCSKDPQAALSQAMHGQPPVPATCQNMVKQQFLMGRKWGITGTPTIVYSDGTIWDGYLSPDKLARDAVKHSGG